MAKSPEGAGPRDYIAGKGSFVRAIANFICERRFWRRHGCDSVDVTSAQLTNRYVISVTIM